MPEADSAAVDRVLGLDHVLTYIRDETLDDALERYRHAGFSVDPQQADFPRYGLRNGFVRFGYETLELCQVVDEAACDPAMPCDPAVRAAARPFAIGFAHDDARAFGCRLIDRGFRDPPPRIEPPETTGDDPAFTLAILDEILSGVATFAVSYREPRSRWPAADRLHPAPANGIGQWTGTVMVTDRPDSRAADRRDVLAPGTPLQGREDGVALSLPDGTELRWTTPERWHRWSGNQAAQLPHRYAEIGCLEFRAESLDRAERSLAAARWHGRRVALAGGNGLLVAPNRHDGVRMLIRA